MCTECNNFNKELTELDRRMDSVHTGLWSSITRVKHGIDVERRELHEKFQEHLRNDIRTLRGEVKAKERT